MAKQPNTKKGFTIIEVVLVLAIAGLIFLMVFVALPALQRSQRDTQRRQDYADLLASVNSYITNNNGSLPADGEYTNSSSTMQPNKYINSTGNGPSGNPYTIKVLTCTQTNCGNPTTEKTEGTGKSATKIGASNTTEGLVNIVKKATCTDGRPTQSNSTKAFAIYGPLETGTYCQSSN